MAGARTFRLALRDSLPVLMGYTTMGFVAGVLLAAKGNVALAPLWGFLSSALWVTGTMSIAGVPHIAAHISAAAFALMTLAVNFRYAFYGFSMLGRWIESASPIKDPEEHLRYCTYLSALNHSYWIVGVTSGAVAVALLGMVVDPDSIRSWTNGMEFAMLALFLVIFTDQMRGVLRRGR